MRKIGKSRNKKWKIPKYLMFKKRKTLHPIPSIIVIIFAYIYIYIYLKSFLYFVCVHNCFMFIMFLYIWCLYLTFYFNIVIVDYYYCVGYPRCVLDHLLTYEWDVPWGGRNPIPPMHLGFYLLPFNFFLSHLFSCTSLSPLNFLPSHLFSFTSPSPYKFLAIPFNFLHIPIPLYFIALIYIDTHTSTHIISRHLKKRFSNISLKWF